MFFILVFVAQSEAAPGSVCTQEQVCLAITEAASEWPMQNQCVGWSLQALQLLPV